MINARDLPGVRFLLHAYGLIPRKHTNVFNSRLITTCRGTHGVVTTRSYAKIGRRHRDEREKKRRLLAELTRLFDVVFITPPPPSRCLRCFSRSRRFGREKPTVRVRTSR